MHVIVPASVIEEKDGTLHCSISKINLSGSPSVLTVLSRGEKLPLVMVTLRKFANHKKLVLQDADR